MNPNQITELTKDSPAKPKRRDNRPAKLRRPTITDGRRAQITSHDAEDICKLVAKGLNIAESCSLIGIKRHSFDNWRQRHADEYEHIFTRIRASRLDNLINQVDKAANGLDGVRHDWRAASWQLGVAEPARFAANPGRAEVSVAPAIAADLLASLAAQVYGSKPAPVIDVAPEPVALPEQATGQKE